MTVVQLYAIALIVVVLEASLTQMCLRTEGFAQFCDRYAITLERESSERLHREQAMVAVLVTHILLKVER